MIIYIYIRVLPCEQRAAKLRSNLQGALTFGCPEANMFRASAVLVVAFAHVARAATGSDVFGSDFRCCRGVPVG